MVLATKALVNLSASPAGAKALLGLGVPSQALGRALALDKELRPGENQAEGAGRDGVNGAAPAGSQQGQSGAKKGAGSSSGDAARLEDGRRLLQSLNVMLLANLTQTEAGAAAVLNTDTVREGSLYCASSAEPCDSTRHY